MSLSGVFVLVCTFLTKKNEIMCIAQSLVHPPISSKRVA